MPFWRSPPHSVVPVLYENFSSQLTNLWLIAVWPTHSLGKTLLLMRIISLTAWLEPFWMQPYNKPSVRMVMALASLFLDDICVPDARIWGETAAYYRNCSGDKCFHLFSFICRSARPFAFPVFSSPHTSTRFLLDKQKLSLRAFKAISQEKNGWKSNFFMRRVDD